MSVITAPAPYALDPNCPHLSLTDQLNVSQEEVRRAFSEEGHLYLRLWTCDACGGRFTYAPMDGYNVDGKRATKRQRIERTPRRRRP